MRWPKAPILVHPKPARGILPDDRFKLVPAKLCNFLIRRLGRNLKLRMKDDATTPAGQRFLMHRHDRQTGAAVQPGVGEGDRHLHSKAIDRDAWLARMEGEVDQNRHGPLPSKRLVEAHNRTFALRHLVAGLLAQAVKDRIELRILNSCAMIVAGMPE